MVLKGNSDKKQHDKKQYDAAFYHDAFLHSCLLAPLPPIVLGRGDSISDLEDEILLEEELIRELESKLNHQGDQGGLRRLRDSSRRNFRNKYVLNHISRLKGDPYRTINSKSRSRSRNNPFRKNIFGRNFNSHARFGY